MLLFFVFQAFVAGVFGESVSVLEAYSVTLHTNLTVIQEDDVLQWRFGPQGTLIAQINRGANKSVMYDDVLDGIFSCRLKLDSQTGGLTIMNIRTIHSGIYEVTSSKSNKIFNVSVVPVDEVKSVSVLERDSFTLNTDVTETHAYDAILWRFEYQNPPVAELNRKARTISTRDSPDGIFRDKLKLDYLTGALTIRNAAINHSGLYEADISGSGIKHTIHKTFKVTVSGEIVPKTAKAGESVTLQTGFTEIQIYDFITWIFGDTVIAEIYNAAQPFYIYDGDDERFRDRLQLDNQTGSLTIIKCDTSNAGLYELKINSNRHNVHKRFNLTVSESGAFSVAACIVTALLAAAVLIGCYYKISKLKSVANPLSVPIGDNVTLPADAKLQTNDEILWTFGDKKYPVAEIKGGAIFIFDEPDERFRGRLMLDRTTGSLTIANAKNTDAGSYKLQITHKRKTSFKRFHLTVFEKMSAMAGQTVTLTTNAELQTDDEVLWMIGDTVIAKTKVGTRLTTTSLGPDGRFRGRLKLDPETGSLTITDTTTEDTGEYKLKITRSRNAPLNLFRVTVLDHSVFRERIPEKRHLLH